MTVLVTGADGFAGRHLQQMLRERSIEYRAAVRVPGDRADARRFVVGDIGPNTDWRAALDGIDAVIHLAGRAHVLKETAADPRAEFMRVNAEGTAALVAAAAAFGVRRFVYVSSIGVLGNVTRDGAFTEDTPPQPHNAYAESKLAGETAVQAAGHAGLETVIVRPPLVYGPHVRANFLRLMQLAYSGLPLPLGGLDNRRSLVSIWNLCDLLVNVLRNPAAPGRSLLVSDAEDLSTPDLIRRLAAAMGRPARLVPFPAILLKGAGRLLGRQAEIAQLCGSLCVDISRTRDRLGWAPPVSVDAALALTARWYVSDRPGA